MNEKMDEQMSGWVNGWRWMEDGSVDGWMVGSVVCASLYRVRFVLSFCLFVCFSSVGQD